MTVIVTVNARVMLTALCVAIHFCVLVWDHKCYGDISAHDTLIVLLIKVTDLWIMVWDCEGYADIAAIYIMQWYLCSYSSGTLAVYEKAVGTVRDLSKKVSGCQLTHCPD